MDFEFEKRTLPDGWCEIRILAQRPLVTEDYKYTGKQARECIAHFCLSSAAGIAHRLHQHELESALQALYALAIAQFDAEPPQH